MISVHTVFTLLLVGLSVGLGNFGASVAIGLDGVDRALRLRIAVVFGAFETLMPIVGLVLGHQIAGKIGGHSNVIGGVLLGLTGLYIVYSGLRKEDEKAVEKANHEQFGKLLLTGLSLSIDNLIVGFSLGAYHQPLILAAAIIGIASISLSLLGLELGSRLGSKVEGYSELLSGLILVAIGAAIYLKIL
jgi:manganese efflux pump family protein